MRFVLLLWHHLQCLHDPTGLFQWVVDTYPGGSGTGTPPANRYELEPNSVQFMFSKEVNTYGYPEATKDNQE